jgi:hypothetical protein
MAGLVRPAARALHVSRLASWGASTQPTNHPASQPASQPTTSHGNDSPAALLRSPVSVCSPAMFHDLNVPWTNAKELQRAVAFLDECKFHLRSPCFDIPSQGRTYQAQWDTTWLLLPIHTGVVCQQIW